MRDKILEILSGTDKALSSIELLEALNMNEVSELTSLYEVLNDIKRRLNVGPVMVLKQAAEVFDY